jgi:hypothetical protein
MLQELVKWSAFYFTWVISVFFGFHLIVCVGHTLAYVAHFLRDVRIRAAVASMQVRYQLSHPTQFLFSKQMQLAFLVVYWLVSIRFSTKNKKKHCYINIYTLWPYEKLPRWIMQKRFPKLCQNKDYFDDIN